MKVKYTEKDMYKVINALDFYSRIYIGQYNRILYDVRWHKNCLQLDQLEREFIDLLQKIRNILLPGLNQYAWHASYGIFSDEIDFHAGAAYDLQQVFRYELAYFKEPEGGITVDFRNPLKAESDPYIWPKAKCFTEKGIIYVEVDICNEQYDIINNALEIQKYLIKGDVLGIFKYYTDNEEALSIAKEVTKLMNTINNK